MPISKQRLTKEGRSPKHETRCILAGMGRKARHKIAQAKETIRHFGVKS